MPPQGKTVSVKPFRGATSRNATLYENRTLYATIAFYYPQYKLQDVEKLPYRDVVLLLKTAQSIEAQRMYNLTMIASAPQSKNGKGVKTLLQHFKEIIDK